LPTQIEKALLFQSMHQSPETFVVANPWDAGSARILTSLGFPALSTTSAGLANTLGCRDRTNGVSRDAGLQNARSIVEATHLPVAADLENGYGDKPEDAAETIHMAAEEAGLVGGSIEDSSGDPEHPIYDYNHAVERIAAAAAAARALHFPFMLVARTENYLYGRRDLDDTIRRLQAFERAGAEVLFAPGVVEAEEIRTLCASVSKPVNVLAGIRGRPPLTVSELAALGVRRISLGGAFSRAALTAVIRGAREVLERGTFDFAIDALPGSELAGFFETPGTARQSRS
jgi:2-methylisocitrate lyase-like PEP mutase family enzyme